MVVVVVKNCHAWRVGQSTITPSPSRALRRTESSDLLSVLDQLDTDTLSDSRVGLLGLNTDLLEDDALGVGGSTERRRLEGGSQKALLEGQIGPALLAAVVAQLARGVETSWLSCETE